jgi:PQQ enzyme repeat
MKRFIGAVFAALTLTLSALSTAAAAGPNVTVLPAISPPTTQVKVSGAGFTRFEAIDIFFDTADLQLTAANSSGSFTKIAITVPRTAVPGRHSITAIGRRSGTSAHRSFLVQTNWSEFGFNLQDSRDNIYENVLTSANASSLNNLWAATTGGFVSSSPAVTNGVIYVGSGNGGLYALNAITGKQLWVANTGGAIFSSPAAIAVDTVVRVKWEIRCRSIWLSVPTCSLQSRTRRAVARGPAALLDFRCVRRPRMWQIGTAE